MNHICPKPLLKFKRPLRRTQNDSLGVITECELPTVRNYLIHKVKAELTFAITGEDVDYIINNAFVGNVGSWSHQIDPVGCWPSDSASEQLIKSGSLLLRDNSGSVYELTTQKILDGIRLFLSNLEPIVCGERCRIEICDIDSQEADEIVQYALFGKIIHPQEG